MRVTVHEFRGTESKRELLEELFRKHLYPDVSVTSELFPPERGQSDQSWRYVKLLQAATPPQHGITLTVDNVTYGGYRAYIRAYFALTGRSLIYDENLETNFFPAVSVQDRMVLVPHGLRPQLAKGINDMWVFPSFRDGGLLETDFRDDVALRTAVRTVSQRVHTDFFKDLQAYARFQELHSLPLQELADDLNIDLGYIQHVLRGNDRIFDEASYQDLEWTISPEELPVNRWTKVTLSLKNGSDQALEKLSIYLRGPVKVSPERIELSVAPQSSAETMVAIKPEESGDYPLEIVGVLAQDKPLAALVHARPLWVRFT